MEYDLDDTDKKILRALQEDAGRSLDEIARAIGSSKTPVWTRIRRMRAAGILGAQTVLLDPDALGFEATFFVLVRTSTHDQAWQEQFLQAVLARPEVQQAHRLAGDVDYILKVIVPNARAYDRFYQALIRDVPVGEVSALLSMEAIKDSPALPI